MSNATGSNLLEETIDQAFCAYDNLPLSVRDVLKFGPSDWHLGEISREYNAARRADKPLADFAYSLRIRLGRASAKDCYRIYGPDHPEANNFGRRLRPLRGNNLWGAA